MVKRFILFACLSLAVSCAGPEQPGPQRPADLRRSPDGGHQVVTNGVSETLSDPAIDPNRNAGLSTGQSLYVPVYSHVYHGSRARQFNLACTLSIRNTDTRDQLEVSLVDYYDTTGKLVGHYVDGRRTLAPLETIEFFIEEKDISGGSGANFIVRWQSPVPVNVPVVEAVMIGVHDGQGISFVSQAHEIVE